MGRFANLAFTPAVKAIQERLGSRRSYARIDGKTERDVLGVDETAFIGERDSFYMAEIAAAVAPTLARLEEL